MSCIYFQGLGYRFSLLSPGEQKPCTLFFLLLLFFLIKTRLTVTISHFPSRFLEEYWPPISWEIKLFFIYSYNTISRQMKSIWTDFHRNLPIFKSSYPFVPKISKPLIHSFNLMTGLALSFLSYYIFNLSIRNMWTKFHQDCHNQLEVILGFNLSNILNKSFKYSLINNMVTWLTMTSIL